MDGTLHQDAEDWVVGRHQEVYFEHVTFEMPIGDLK
jgi:hypothetical protein